MSLPLTQNTSTADWKSAVQFAVEVEKPSHQINHQMSCRLNKRTLQQIVYTFQPFYQFWRLVQQWVQTKNLCYETAQSALMMTAWGKATPHALKRAVGAGGSLAVPGVGHGCHDRRSGGRGGRVRLGVARAVPASSFLALGGSVRLRALRRPSLYSCDADVGMRVSLMLTA